MDAVGVASVTVLIGIAGAYLYVWSIYRASYFALIAVAWIANAAYIGIEASIAEGSSDFVALVTLSATSLISTACFYLALGDLRGIHSPGDRRARKTIVFLLAVAAFGIVLVSSPPAAAADFRGEILLAANVLATGYVLLALGWQFYRSATDGLLLFARHKLDDVRGPEDVKREFIVRGTSDTVVDSLVAGGDSGGTVAVITPDVETSLDTARRLFAITFLAYGALQISYPLRAWFLQQEPRAFVALFWFALALKALNGLGVGFLLLGDFKSTAETLRVRSVAEELGVLTASIEHDIRNPLSVLRKEIDSGRRKFQHDNALMERFGRMLYELDRMQTAVDIIPSAREVADNFRLLAEPNNVVAIVRDAAKAVKKADRKGDAEVDLDSARSEIVVKSDRERLQQAFVNIINNGIEACREKTEQRAPRVEIKCGVDRAGARAVIVFHDRGTGIQSDDLAKVLRPFFSTKRNRGRNRGIGLFIAARVTRIHGGELTLTSDGATYTDVCISLPLVKGALS